MSQCIWQAVHTDFDDGAKNISMKNVIKGAKSLQWRPRKRMLRKVVVDKTLIFLLISKFLKCLVIFFYSNFV